MRTSDHQKKQTVNETNKDTQPTPKQQPLTRYISRTVTKRYLPYPDPNEEILPKFHNDLAPTYHKDYLQTMMHKYTTKNRHLQWEIHMREPKNLPRPPEGGRYPGKK